MTYEEFVVEVALCVAARDHAGLRRVYERVVEAAQVALEGALKTAADKPQPGLASSSQVVSGATKHLKSPF